MADGNKLPTLLRLTLEAEPTDSEKEEAARGYTYRQMKLRDKIVALGRESLADVIQAFESGDAGLAAKACSYLSSHAAGAVPAMVDAIRNDRLEEDLAACCLARVALGQNIEDRVADAMITLLQETKHGELRRSAIRMLGKCPGRVDRSVPVLVAEIDGPLEKEALDSIRFLGPKAGLAVPALLRRLDDDDRVPAMCATLGAMGPAAASVGSRLMPLLQSSIVRSRVAAADALGRIGYDEAYPILLGMIAAVPDKSSRQTVARAVVRLHLNRDENDPTLDPVVGALIRQAEARTPGNMGGFFLLVGKWLAESAVPDE